MATALVDCLTIDFTTMYKEADDRDVCVIVGEEPNSHTFHAHSCILRGRSSYFRKKLEPTPIPTTRDGAQKIIRKPNIQPAIFEMVLKYLYTGVVTLDKENGFNISALLVAADELGLTVLVDYIQDYLIKYKERWIQEHLVKLLQITSRIHSFHKLYQYCQEAISIAPELLFKSDDFSTIEFDVLQALIRRDDLAIEEIEIWNRMIEWGVARTGISGKPSDWRPENIAKLKDTLEHLIPLIRFVGISSVDFYHKVLPYKKILPKSLYQELLRYYLEPGYMPAAKLLPTRRPSSVLNSVLLNKKQAEWIVKHVCDMEKVPTTVSTKSASNNPGQLLNSSPLQFKLLCRGTQHGFTPGAFHRQCDNKGPTLTIMRVAGGNEVIGGYNPINWQRSENGVSERTTRSFICAFGDANTNGSVYSSVKDPSNAIYNFKNYGPRFSAGHDCILGFQGMPFNVSGSCRCIKNAYEHPVRDTDDYFAVDEYEVFQVMQTDVTQSLGLQS